MAGIDPHRPGLIRENKTKRSYYDEKHTKIHPQPQLKALDMLDFEYPHNNEVECALIGTLFAYPDEISTAESHLFYNQANRIIFSTLKSLYERDNQVSVTGLKAYLSDTESLADIGGAAYLGEVAQCAMLPGSIPEYIRVLTDLYQRREGMEAVMRAHQRLQNASPENTAAKIISDMEDQLHSLTQSTSGGDVINQVSAVDSTLATIEDAYNNPGVRGITTGFNSLDTLLKGLSPSTLNILAGRPAMGKSALAMNITTHAAANGKRVLFCSLEMPAEQIIQRMIASDTGLSTQAMASGEMDVDEVRRVMEAGQKIRSLPIYWNDKPPLTGFRLLNQARRLQTKYGLDMVVVDFLQLMDGPGEYRGQRVQQITEISRNLKLMALQLDIPVVALSQLSRGVEQRENKRPMMSDLRESGSIEQDADVVMFVYRDEYYAANAQPQKIGAESEANFNKRMAQWQERIDASAGKAEVIVAKHRGGATGVAHLKFAGARTAFYE